MLGSFFKSDRAVYARHQSDLVVERCSSQKGWRGLHLEVGHNRGCDVRSLMLQGHLIGMQITGQPLAVEIYEDGQWVPATLPSHQLFIHPAGTPLNIRHDLWTRWAFAIVDHPALGSRRAPADTAGWSDHDQMLTLLFQALIEQLCHERRDTSGDRALAQSLIDSFMMALHQRAPAPAAAPARGGIAPYMVADLRAWIEKNLEAKIGVQDMADRLGYSCAHFAREFKREVGVTPHGFLQDIRLSTAMDLARRGAALIDIAHRCGFADQAHLSNAFKSRFGFSPASLRPRSN